MTYWLVIFPQPETLNEAPIKLMLTRAKYEFLCQLEGASVETGKRENFTLLNKRIFAVEQENAAFIVCDAKRNRQE